MKTRTVAFLNYVVGGGATDGKEVFKVFLNKRLVGFVKVHLPPIPSQWEREENGLVLEEDTTVIESTVAQLLPGRAITIIFTSANRKGGSILLR
jgi:hypothetical protein